MTSICVHRAPRTPPDSTPGHISSRDVLQEAHRPDTDLPRTALTALKARLESDPTLSCNSSVTAIAIPRASKAHQLARWHRFVSIEHREPLQTALQGTSARAMVCRKNPDLPHTALRARLSLIPRFPAIHLTRQSPFYRTPRHIGSRDGIDLCPSSAANPFRHCSRAHSLAR